MSKLSRALHARNKIKRRHIESEGLSGPLSAEAAVLNRLLWSFAEYMERFECAYVLAIRHNIKAVRALHKSTRHPVIPLTDKKNWTGKRGRAYDAFVAHTEASGIIIRDACLSAYHAKHALSQINRAARHAHSDLKAHINFDALDMTERQFKDAFVGIREIRHGLTHAGEMAALPENMSESPFENILATPFVNGVVMGNRLAVRWKQKTYTLKLTPDKIDAFFLDGVLLEKAFKPTEKWSRRLMKEAHARAAAEQPQQD